MHVRHTFRHTSDIPETYLILLRKTRALPRRSGVTGGCESDIGHAGNTERTITVAEHQQGSMDIRAQEKTFHGFVKMVSWGAAICIAVVIFMALANA